MRKLVCWVVLLVGLAGPVWAQSLVIAPPHSDSSGCDLAVAGFTSKQGFMRFFDELKQAATADDKRRLSELVLYPLRVNGPRAMLIRTPAEFQRDFAVIFPEKVRRVIEAQSVGDLFCRDQGVMYGNGEVWVGTDGARVGIEAINLG